MSNICCQVAIVDESHYMKSRKSATTKFLVPLLHQAYRKILLTGTPALNRPEEVIFIFQFLYNYINYIGFNVQYVLKNVPLFSCIMPKNSPT